MAKLTAEIIEAAIVGFEAKKHAIDLQIAELRSMLNGKPAEAAPAAKRGKSKRKLSPEALERMREGQKRRWAAARGESPAPAKTSKPKRRISAAGRKAIAEAQRKRWAAKKAAAA
jgi:hypothetical protein